MTAHGCLPLAALAALLLAGAVLPGCAPRFDMVGEEATSNPVANKRVGQEPKSQ